MAVCPLRLQLILAALLLSQAVAQWPAAPNTVRLTKGHIQEIGLSPGDGVLRITTGAGIWLHDPETLVLRQLLAGSVHFTRFSDDGRLLAAALRDTSVVVWELASGGRAGEAAWFREPGDRDRLRR